MYEYLVSGGEVCMAGFVLKNALWDNGNITCSVCAMDADSNLTKVVETQNIIKTAEGLHTDGVKLDLKGPVSMIDSGFLNAREEGFVKFFPKEVRGNPQIKAEYLISTFIGEQLAQGKMWMNVLKTNNTCTE